jgi:hypothetical protein
MVDDLNYSNILKAREGLLVILLHKWFGAYLEVF